MVSTAQAATGYTTGEIGMLYRMEETGANGVTGWTDWSIANGTTFWLNLNLTGMTYPITLAPAGDTFGYTSAGSSTGAGSINEVFISVNSYLGAINTGASMSIYANQRSGVNGNVQMGVYDTSGNFISNANTPSVYVNNASAQWWSANFGTPPTFSAINYLVAWNLDAAITLHYISTGGSGVYGLTKSFGTWVSQILGSVTAVGRQYSIYCTYAVPTPSITNSPTTLNFGTVMPNTTYYANGSGYSNPVTSGQCTFTITNTGTSSCNISLTCTNATGGNTWTLVSGTPSGNQFKVIAVYSGENPASGLVLTTSNQSFYSGLAASGTLKWDFEEVTGAALAAGKQAHSRIVPRKRTP